MFFLWLNCLVQNDSQYVFGHYHAAEEILHMQFFHVYLLLLLCLVKCLFILHENKNNNKMKVKAKCNWKERINIGCLEQNQKML